jgi:hypothetical protein
VFDAGKATFVPGGGPGSTRAAIYGDPEQSGPYLHVIRVPPGQVGAPHRYSDTRTYTVIAGTWYVGFGERAEPAIGLPAGSFYRLPAGTVVVTATKDDGAVIQIGGIGPTHHIDVAR